MSLLGRARMGVPLLVSVRVDEGANFFQIGGILSECLLVIQTFMLVLWQSVKSGCSLWHAVAFRSRSDFLSHFRVEILDLGETSLGGVRVGFG